MTCTFKNVRSQLLGSRLSRAAGDCYNWFSPGRVHPMRELLQRCDSVVNQQQPILHLLEIRIASHPICARDSRNSTAVKRVRNKAMRIDKLTIKTGAGVVLLRQRKEQLARACRTRVDGIISNLFVKHLGADARGIRAHQIRCLSNLHVITASPRSIDSSGEGVFVLAGPSRHSTNLESELWLIETF